MSRLNRDVASGGKKDDASPPPYPAVSYPAYPQAPGYPQAGTNPYAYPQQAGGYPAYPQAGGYSAYPQAGGYSAYPQAGGYPAYPQAGGYSAYPQSGGYPGAYPAPMYSAQGAAVAQAAPPPSYESLYPSVQGMSSGGGAGAGAGAAGSGTCATVVATPTTPPAVAATGWGGASTPPSAPPAVYKAVTASGDSELPPAVAMPVPGDTLYPSVTAATEEAKTAIPVYTPYSAALRKGFSYVQFLFKDKANAEAFIRDNKLMSENRRRRGQLKTVDSKRFAREGLHLVRMGEAAYKSLRSTTYPDLPAYAELNRLPQATGMRLDARARLYTALHAQIVKGQSGMIHFVFKTNEAAKTFIAKHDLKSENNADASRRGQPKHISKGRYPGKFMVRVGPALYSRLRASYAASGKAEDSLPDFTSTHRASKK